LLLGRACLGWRCGFWAMSASLTMRLVPMRVVPKALSVIFGAVSIALVIAAPLGSFLGGIIGWRNVFNGAAVMGVVCTIGCGAAVSAGRADLGAAKYVRPAEAPRRDGRDVRHFYGLRRPVRLLYLYSPGVYDAGGFDVDGLTLVLLSLVSPASSAPRSLRCCSNDR
jgi:DHA1 family purine ribonucleoside efflux pump-like MFS transporter